MAKKKVKKPEGDTSPMETETETQQTREIEEKKDYSKHPKFHKFQGGKENADR